eukprot:TRINITY_DN11830_c0_g1_i2.p1 TRINITY_DN11830_c0_g1~~TRINITY_DN11830_c0_g1_i2.p1  ORF type:complete len:162 (+),score=21.72 TRINITY_DN11830_c0_g1_i2:40-486(+)
MAPAAQKRTLSAHATSRACASSSHVSAFPSGGHSSSWFEAESETSSAVGTLAQRKAAKLALLCNRSLSAAAAPQPSRRRRGLDSSSPGSIGRGSHAAWRQRSGEFVPSPRPCRPRSAASSKGGFVGLALPCLLTELLLEPDKDRKPDK